MSVPVLDAPRRGAKATPLAWVSEADWIEIRNRWVRDQAARYDYVVIGSSSVTHPQKLRDHSDGSVTVEPACGTGYSGLSSERVRLVSSPVGEMCKRRPCARYVAERRAPRLPPAPVQLALAL